MTTKPQYKLLTKHTIHSRDQYRHKTTDTSSMVRRWRTVPTTMLGFKTPMYYHLEFRRRVRT